MLYSYEGKDSGGRSVSGTVEAENERAAANQILKQGYFLMRLLPAATVGRTVAAAPASPHSSDLNMAVPQAPWYGTGSAATASYGDAAATVPSRELQYVPADQAFPSRLFPSAL